MARARAEGRTDGFALGLLLATTLIMLFTVGVGALWYDEVSGASPFGRPGTVVVAVVLAVITLAGVVVAARSVVAARRVVSGVAFAGAVVALVMAIFFLTSGSLAIIFTFLIGYVALALGLIGRAVLRNTTSATGG